MKILFLNTNDKQGGASIACRRIFKGIEKEGNIEIKMLVKNKVLDDLNIISEEKLTKKILGQAKTSIDLITTKFLKTKNEILHSPAFFSALNKKTIKEIDPDIVHIHWICEGFASVDDIKKIKKPIVWTIHDMWPFCGAEHYAKDTTRYIEGYNRDNRPDYESGLDLNKWTWKRKLKKWKNLDITVVAPSRWIAECARKSKLFRDKKIEIIPYGIDMSVFKPIDKKIAREILNLPEDKKLILFGAENVARNPRKGFEYLRKALNKISSNSQQNIEIIVFGSSEQKKPIDLKFKINYLGKIGDEVTLALIYSAADVFVTPSLEDNLPNTVIESLSCGTPCVGFNIGGIPDMIEHKVNGYLAKYKDIDDLSQGIEWLLENELVGEISKNARMKVLNNFEEKMIAQKYMELYSKILEK